MTKKQIEKAQTLEGEGYSQREIAGLLGVPLSTVNRSLKAEREGSSLAGEDEEDDKDQSVNAPVSKKPVTTSADVQMLEIKLRHEKEMAELELKREQIKLDSQTVQARQQEADNHSEQLKQFEAERMAEEAKEGQRIEDRQTLLVSKFNRLLRELLHNCKEATWEADDVNDFNERIEVLKKKLVKFCAAQNIDEEELALYHNINALLDFWGEIKEECTGFFSDDVELDLDKEKIAEIRSWLIDEFHEAHPGDEEEQEYESDNYEDDEEEDDELELDDDDDETASPRHKVGKS